ncbi:ATP-binding protein [Neorhizobium galegae]|uniref:ATP-binding protein n=1 Tax=Neorhizobium galegae TaxID=399 RepID=A0A6A1TGM6_NEOGA|nr:ATP-binding protein [Neorhizobium galegae]KAB1082625.1 ATP-binding protein [Neorhizobium galegae]
MSGQAAFSLGHIAAIQRQELDAGTPIDLASLAAEAARPGNMLRVLSLPRSEGDAARAVRRRMMGDTLAGLGTTGETLVHLVSCAGGIVSSGYGLAGGTASEMDLAALIGANHPGLFLETTQLESLIPAGLSVARLLVGTPSPALPETPDDPGPMDRFIAGMRDAIGGGADSHDWAVTFVADRLPWRDVTQRLAAALGELRTVADQDRGNQPLAAHYRQLLEVFAEKLTIGRAIGMWSVSATIAAQDAAVLARASALLQSVLSGSQSRPDPIRSLSLTTVPALPSRFTAAPFANSASTFWTGAFSSLLHSEELAAITALPRLERPDFEIRRAPRFKQALAAGGAASIVLGTVLERGQPSGPKYMIEPRSLTAHALVAGASGSGKTNTVFRLIREAAARGVPFLAIEPTKSEYRALMEDAEFGAILQVYTLGNETVSPLRVNPFEVPTGMAVQTHLDRLKALFNGSFTMYAPMPQVLERCLTEIYEDCGYDLATGSNARGTGFSVFPTLGSLQRKIEHVVPSLGYDHRITADVSAALRTRIDSLRIGAKGLMFETEQPLDMASLLAKPTVIELDAIGDDDEKAFIVGLLFTRLAAEMTQRGSSGGQLRHLTIIEEAHRLFTDVPLVAGSEVGNPKGKAVETFCNILSEIRAYGEGIVIVDQIPTRLARDTIKNSNLKIMHRMPASDDREAMGRAMVQDNEEIAAGAALPVGVALVHTGGQGGSFEVAMPRAPLLATPVSRAEADAAVARRMHPQAQAIAAGPTMRQIQTLLEEPEVGEQTFRLLQSLASVSAPPVDVLLPLVQSIGRLRHANQTEPLTVTLRALLETCLAEIATAAGWPFDESATLRKILLQAYDSIIASLSQRVAPGDVAAEFRGAWQAVGTVQIYPFANCQAVCPSFLCRYRHVAARLAESATLRPAWTRGLNNNTDHALWQALANVASRAVERGLSSQAASVDRRQMAACFVQHSLDQDRVLEHSLKRKVFVNVLAEIDARLAAYEQPAGAKLQAGG